MAYYLKSHTIALTDDQGEVTDRVDEAWQCVDGRLLSNRLKGEKNGSLIGNSLNQYSPYGIVTHLEGNTDTPFLYSGQHGVLTDSNGLLYMRARYYNPTIRRFINADPIQFEGGTNWYLYANGNPILYVDPSGLFTIGIGGEIGIGAVTSFALEGYVTFSANNWNPLDWRLGVLGSFEPGIETDGSVSGAIGLMYSPDADSPEELSGISTRTGLGIDTGILTGPVSLGIEVEANNTHGSNFLQGFAGSKGGPKSYEMMMQAELIGISPVDYQLGFEATVGKSFSFRDIIGSGKP